MQFYFNCALPLGLRRGSARYWYGRTREVCCVSMEEIPLLLRTSEWSIHSPVRKHNKLRCSPPTKPWCLEGSHFGWLFGPLTRRCFHPLTQEGLLITRIAYDMWFCEKYSQCFIRCFLQMCVQDLVLVWAYEVCSCLRRPNDICSEFSPFLCNIVCLVSLIYNCKWVFLYLLKNPEWSWDSVQDLHLG